jgi:hypothetical protein
VLLRSDQTLATAVGDHLSVLRTFAGANQHGSRVALDQAVIVVLNHVDIFMQRPLNSAAQETAQFSTITGTWPLEETIGAPPEVAAKGRSWP